VESKKTFSGRVRGQSAMCIKTEKKRREETGGTKEQLRDGAITKNPRTIGRSLSGAGGRG